MIDTLSQFLSVNVLTNNEVNNIIYLLMKYTFNISNPNNQDIHLAMLELVDDPGMDKIIDQMFSFMGTYHPKSLDFDIERQVDHAQLVLNEFLRQPQNLRNDLGRDTDAEEFITKH